MFLSCLALPTQGYTKPPVLRWRVSGILVPQQAELSGALPDGYAKAAQTLGYLNFRKHLIENSVKGSDVLRIWQKSYPMNSNAKQYLQYQYLVEYR